MAQLSHPYVTAGKTIALTRWTFVSKLMFFNMLPRLVIAFHFMATGTICSDFGDQKNKVSVSIVSPSVCHEVMGLDAMILVF